MSQQEQHNVHQLGAFSADALLDKLADLRESLISAWRERAVMLTKEEQARLKREITDTCALLSELVK